MLKLNKYLNFTEQELMYIRYALIEAKFHNDDVKKKYPEDINGCRVHTLISNEEIIKLNDKIKKHIKLNKD